MNLAKLYAISNLPVSFASIFLVSTLFATCFFSFLFFHPDRLDIHELMLINATASKNSEKQHEHGFASLAKSTSLTSTQEGENGFIKLVTSTDEVTSEDADADGLLKSTNSTSGSSKTDEQGLIQPVNSTAAAGTVENENQPIEVASPTTPTNPEENEDTKIVEENGDVLGKIDNTTAPSSTVQEEHLSTEEVTEEGESASTFKDLLTPPENLAKEERIAWFKERIPRIKILKSTKKSRLFNQRVKQFFDGQVTNGTTRPCKVTIFMTWIGPVSQFGQRAVLSLESVFKSHPQGCVVIVSRSLDSKQGRAILEPLSSRGYKVSPVTPDLNQLFDNTPAQAWLNNLVAGNLDPGQIPLYENLPNLISYALLYKYGGIYLDLDMIILKDLSKIRNTLGIAEVEGPSRTVRTLSGAVLIFDKEQPLMLQLIQEFVAHFDGNTKEQDGIHLVTDVVMMVINNDTNYQFNMLTSLAFYPAHWTRIGRYFNQPRDDERSKSWTAGELKVIKSVSHGIHLWNKVSRNMKIEKRSVIGKLVSDHCIICKGSYDSA